VKVFGMLTGTFGSDVVGTLVDEQGHAIAQHVSSNEFWSQRDLRVFHASKLAPEAEFVWLGWSRDGAPKPCAGCPQCDAIEVR